VPSLALLAGAALAWPWFRPLLDWFARPDRFAGDETLVHWTFHAHRAVAMATGAWLVALLAWSGRRRLEGPRRSFVNVLLLAAALLSVATAFLALPVGNEDSLFHAALVLLAVPAAGAVVASDARATKRRTLLVHLAFAPIAACVLFAYVGRPELPLAFTRSGLERLRARHGREQPREAGREHRFPGSRGPDHEDAVSACGGHLERPLRLRLPFHLRQIRVDGRGSRRLRLGPRHRLAAGQMRADLEQRSGLIDIGAVDQSRFVRAPRRQHEGSAVLRGAPGHRQRSANGAQLSGERQLAREFVLAQVVGFELARCREYAQRDRQIEAAAFLAQLRRGESHEVEIVVDQGKKLVHAPFAGRPATLPIA